MKKNFPLLFITFLLWICQSGAQTNFREGLQKSDPVSVDSSLNFKEKIEIHKAFLDKAIQEKDTLKQLYGFLHIFMDYINKEDFPEASRYLLEAENTAEKSKNPGWQGWVSYRSGILYIRTNNEEKAIENYLEAAELCQQAGDSLCVGESWEQLSALNGILGNHVAAQLFFDKAMPLLEKYGSEKQIGTALNNFGILTSVKGNPAEAIPYIKKAIAFNHDIGRYQAEGKGMNNLADAYRRLGRYDEAIATYNESIQFNDSHNFTDNKIRNYMGLYLSYEGKGDYKTANEFLIKRYELRDSITGIKTQEKIYELEAKYNSEKKELDFQISKNELIAAQQSLERMALAFVLLAILISLGLWFWLKERRKTLQKLEKDKEHLLGLTKKLKERNVLITALKEQISAISTNEKTKSSIVDLKENLYNQSILTKADWIKFKILFEKSYPAYLSTLRSTYPTISEAEERLFLFIKLNLVRSEVAEILGISVESVKKTRNRLRKRLGLEKEASLDEYIQRF